MNKVIAGDYVDCSVRLFGEKTSIILTSIINSKGVIEKVEKIELNKENVASYKVIEQNPGKSVSSGVKRGILGAVLLGPVGAVGGAVLAKNKNKYLVEILFKDEKISLLEINDKIYKALIKVLY